MFSGNVCGGYYRPLPARFATAGGIFGNVPAQLATYRGRTYNRLHRPCAERCRSGRTGATGNRVGAQASRGFESRPLRQLYSSRSIPYRPVASPTALIQLRTFIPLASCSVLYNPRRILVRFRVFGMSKRLTEAYARAAAGPLQLPQRRRSLPGGVSLVAQAVGAAIDHRQQEHRPGTRRVSASVSQGSQGAGPGQPPPGPVRGRPSDSAASPPLPRRPAESSSSTAPPGATRSTPASGGQLSAATPFPHFGGHPVNLVSAADAMNALTPIWTAKPAGDSAASAPADKRSDELGFGL